MAGAGTKDCCRKAEEGGWRQMNIPLRQIINLLVSIPESQLKYAGPDFANP